MNYSRIYEYRFQNVNHRKKLIIWEEFSHWLYSKYLKKPNSILEPAGGMCEFINNVPAKEKWTVDIQEAFLKKHAAVDVNIIVGDIMNVELQRNHFDAVFISNFLEHLQSQEEVSYLLERMNDAMKIGGRIAIMGPNFKYAFREYFDFADHTVILSELGVAEHLFGAGFKIIKVIPQFLPLSFRSGGFLPVTSLTVKSFLNFPFAWKFLGKQFLIIAEK